MLANFSSSLTLQPVADKGRLPKFSPLNLFPGKSPPSINSYHFEIPFHLIQPSGGSLPLRRSSTLEKVPFFREKHLHIEMCEPANK